ncbi:MAG: hypothetical protein A3B70_08045 [Deltaproteobacteria bacterium RIFCSPHIGHO2_02_FULL_40_11]|nr:MAG: hypothetical protein A3B70_08045 [Deltaproteobacteria bacterium RIFCSPHIGHO2_02_FULL_40_11]
MRIEEKLVRLLKQKRKTLSLAESCTGGWVAKRLTDIPGASLVFQVGVVTYSAKAKQKILKIPAQTLKRYGEVSEQTAFLMAKGAQKISKTDYAASITGIAGPTGGTKAKPIGTVCFALLSKNRHHIKKVVFHGNRTQIRSQSATTVLELLYRWIKE